jgi:hypothetical protein
LGDEKALGSLIAQAVEEASAAEKAERASTENRVGGKIVAFSLHQSRLEKAT